MSRAIRRGRAVPRALLLAFVACLCPAGASGLGRPIVSEFSLTGKELAKMTAGLPKSIQQGITARPADFMHLLAEVLAEPADLLVLVDKAHPLPSDAVPPDLVSLNDYRLSVSRKELQLRKSIMPAVLAMDNAARAAGAPLLYSSSYRSYDYQADVYARAVQQEGQAQADRESARPGASQHQLGTVIDFGSITDAFADTRQGRWLAAHAWEYGFSLSYPDGYEAVTGYRHESWHYRYITKPAARLQREFFGDVQQYMLVFLNDNRAALEASLRKGD
jgi:D-alanyl-D-alanine carboxypeptidase